MNSHSKNHIQNVIYSKNQRLSPEAIQRERKQNKSLLNATFTFIVHTHIFFLLRDREEIRSWSSKAKVNVMYIYV